MKKSFLSVIGLAFLSLLILSFNKNRNNLVGDWQITAVESKTPISENLKKEMLSKGKVTFTEDGRVHGFITRDIANGSFALTEKGKNLVIKEDTGTPYACESVINEKELRLDYKNQMTLKFEKIKK